MANITSRVARTQTLDQDFQERVNFAVYYGMSLGVVWSSDAVRVVVANGGGHVACPPRPHVTFEMGWCERRVRLEF